MTQTVSIYDHETGEQITREMTTAENKAYEAEQEANATAKAELKSEADAAATQKAALLARLGITADEAKLLIG